MISPGYPRWKRPCASPCRSLKMYKLSVSLKASDGTHIPVLPCSDSWRGLIIWKEKARISLHYLTVTNTTPAESVIPLPHKEVQKITNMPRWEEVYSPQNIGICLQIKIDFLFCCLFKRTTLLTFLSRCYRLRPGRFDLTTGGIFAATSQLVSSSHPSMLQMLGITMKKQYFNRLQHSKKGVYACLCMYECVFMSVYLFLL